MEPVDRIAGLQEAESLKPALLEARARCRAARKSREQAGGEEKAIQRDLGTAESRLAELQSGRGAKLANFGQATVYEFWIQVPGFAGPIRGTTARVTQRGDIQHVSNVTGKTKGGLGGAVVGGALLGPAGAIVGAVARRKTTVKTDVQKVDTRTFELEITGPGFAWSTVAGPNAESALSKLRDVANARGSNTDDVKQLAATQSERVDALRANSSLAASATQQAASAVDELARAYDSAWAAYADARPPLDDDLRGRWAQSGSGVKVLAAIIGPVALVMLLAWTAAMGARGDGTGLSLALRMTVLYVMAVVAIFVTYLYRVRLVK